MIELCKTYINFLAVTLGNGKIKHQPHISKKILEMSNKPKTLKKLQSFLGIINYVRPFIKDLEKIAGSLYSITYKVGQKHFNQDDIKLVHQIKNVVKNLPH